MLRYLYGKRFGSKIARANRKEGDGVGVGPSRERRLRRATTHLEARGTCVKEIRHVLG